MITKSRNSLAANRRNRGAPDGFTLIELLVVIPIIAILGALLLRPALGRATGKSQAVECMSNNRQLVLAWRLYAQDNGDQLPYAYAPIGTAAAPHAWIPGGGTLDLDLSIPTQQGNRDTDNSIKKSPLWPYCGMSTDIWRCPADKSMGRNPAGQMVPRPRSRSMNLWVGGRGDTPDPRGGWSQGANWTVFRKLSEMTRPGPAMTFVLLDEREDSINDGLFVVQMDGYPGLTQTVMVDFPASYHSQAAGFAFADGHAEIHKWQDPRTYPPLTTVLNVNVPQPNSKDVHWLQDHSTRVY
jgi:prepilin-type N-terminal cleavage/methylation domain-containing protein/prepilin-type processing-associated H-X9-DG protein